MRRYLVSLGILSVFLFLFFSVSPVKAYSKNDFSQQVVAIDLNMSAQNDIMFYDPPDPCSGKKFGGSCGGDITSEGGFERMKELTRKYGVLAMNLQITYGVPWEFILGQTGPESTVGTAGVAKTELADGKYNWMGLSCFTLPCPSYYGDHNMGDYPRPANEGAWYEAYDSLELMFKSYASGDWARNGNYDAALKYTDKNNYDLTNYAVEAFSVYVTGQPGQFTKDHWYVQTTFEYIEKAIRPVAEELGWPTSAELQKQENIEIGGKFPLGTDKSKIYDDSVSCSSTNTTSNTGSSSSSSSASATSNTGNSGSGTEISGSDITWIGDSYSVGARSIIEDKFSGIEFGGSVNDDNSYIQGCRNVATDTNCNANPKKNPAALKVLERIISDGKIKPYLVMAVGTNEGWSDNSIATLEQLISKVPSTKVVLVTSKTADSNYTESNGRLKALADANDNYYLADWAAVADSSYFASDSVHPTSNGGYEKWVEVISNALVSISNCTSHADDYPQYFQNDYENSDHENSDQNWSSIPYGKSTVSNAGCGPTSMAMLTTVATGKDVYPQDIIDITSGYGSYTWTADPAIYDKLVGEKYGFEVEQVNVMGGYDDYIEKMRDYLKKGYMLHISGAGTDPYTSGGHYVGIFKINDDNETVLVADSWKQHGGNKEMTLHDVAYHGIHGSISAIKGNGGNGPCNDNLCSDSNTSSVAENLTEEQAQKIADYYNSDKVSASEWGLSGKNNCFSFSKWFTNALTSIGKTAIPGSGGRDFAHSAAEVGNLEEGTEARPYAVFSVTKSSAICGSAPCGHTGIVVAVDGDDIMTVEANFNRPQADIVHRNASDGYFVNTLYGNTFTYLDPILDKTKLGEIINN